MNRKKLLSLLKRREGVKLDYKLKLDLCMESGKKEFSKDICAIANSRGGRGHLIIGVEDKTKKVVGMDKNSITEEQVQQIISSRCEPPVPISLDFVEIYGKDVGVITIYQSNQKPHQTRDNGAFYIRRGSTTDTMRKQELITAFQENMSLNIELTPVVKSSIEDLDIYLVDKYFANHNITTNDENRKILMENSKIICMDNEEKRYYATLGGLLVFSKINYIYAPNNMIKIVNKIDKSKDEVIIIQGDLLSMLEKSNEIINDILPKEYPTFAVYEGVKNAVLYRDYTIINKEIEIIIKNNSLEVISPGIIIRDTNKETENLSHNYIKRNMWIYEKIITLDNRKIFLQSGRGFSKMKKAFKDIGKVKFINSLRDNSFKVIYPGVDAL
ncbi:MULTISPECIES: AlbA family DNA-binding domain-containing protein [Clostridium]|nr:MULTISPECIES: RNA-binding domain-containing protein [Clostridium]KEH85608.1 ATP-binding protein [Clostridium novyi A str. NCTC 538]KEH85741.1 ATP-binding protein [Clostridium novyi A str. 4540]KEH90936.1 ATP-binding protein [Clostridium novyi A str. BKT29909]KEH94970.1 ATP-binding protein [Clostridium botulinum C/D str. It1]